jgi:hypothetical protein
VKVALLNLQRAREVWERNYVVSDNATAAKAELGTHGYTCLQPHRLHLGWLTAHFQRST